MNFLISAYVSYWQDCVCYDNCVVMVRGSGTHRMERAEIRLASALGSMISPTADVSLISAAQRTEIY